MKKEYTLLPLIFVISFLDASESNFSAKNAQKIAKASHLENILLHMQRSLDSSYMPVCFIKRKMNKITRLLQTSNSYNLTYHAFEIPVKAIIEWEIPSHYSASSHASVRVFQNFLIGLSRYQGKEIGFSNEVLTSEYYQTIVKNFKREKERYTRSWKILYNPYVSEEVKEENKKIITEINRSISVPMRSIDIKTRCKKFLPGIIHYKVIKDMVEIGTK